MKLPFASILFFSLIILCCCVPQITAPIALILGLILSSTLQNPFPEQSTKTVGHLLKASVIGLGFGINTHILLEAGKQSLFTTTFTVTLVLLFGILLGKWFGNESKISLLISVGTAICGGSAIAAVGTAISANNKQLSVASGIVFLLNALALLVFPLVGSYLNLPQEKFGLWAGIAIHDTSSVVGAAAKYGEIALNIATTTKLVRILWIIPLSILAALPYWKRGTQISYPYFILLFFLASVFATNYSAYQVFFQQIYHFAKRGLIVSLFLIGAGISIKDLREIGIKPFLQGLILWVITALSSLIIIYIF